MIRFSRQTDRYAQIEFSNIRPTGQLRDEKIEEIPLGRAKVVDGVTIEASNWDGLVELPISYDGRFGKTTSKEEALALGFKQNIAVEATFSQGGEAAQFKFEQKITTSSETSQDTTTTTGSQESEDRGAGLSPVVPPGCDINFHMSRTTQPTAMRVTGIGQLTHGIRIGKFKGGYFSHKRGEGGKKYSRSLSWSSFEDFLAALKGEAARDIDLALYFKREPNPEVAYRPVGRAVRDSLQGRDAGLRRLDEAQASPGDQAWSQPCYTCQAAGVRHGRGRGLRNGRHAFGSMDSGGDCYRPMPIHSGDVLAVPPDQPAPCSDWQPKRLYR